MICLFLGAVLCGGTAAAQHTLGVTGGYGYGNALYEVSFGNAGLVQNKSRPAAPTTSSNAGYARESTMRFSGPFSPL